MKKKKEDNVILTLNPVWSVCNEKIARELEDIPFFTKEIWIKRRRGKEMMIKKVYLIEDRGDGVFFFLTGFLPRVFKLLDKREINYEYETESRSVEFDNPKLKGITFRDYQEKAIKETLKKGRGVIKAATGTGKTIIMGGVVSAFSEEKCLILAHTRDIVTQTTRAFKEDYGLTGVTEYRKGQRSSRIMCSTIQTFCKVADDFVDYFDVVIIDEAHHVSNFDTMYSSTLEKLQAPVRLGFTATMPVKSEAKMCLEGLIGNQIFDYSIFEASRDGVLAKPKMKIMKSRAISPRRLLNSDNVPVTIDEESGRVKMPSKYRVVYFNGVADNETRNMDIALEATTHIDKGKTVLINVYLTHHGFQIQEVFRDMGYKAMFIYGKTPTEERNRIKQLFKEKKIKCVIASTIWKEGVDVPSIDVCINAAGHKSEIAVIQQIGRGLRKSGKKVSVLVIDFDDTNIHRYLGQQFSDRKQIYKQMGWME